MAYPNLIRAILLLDNKSNTPEALLALQKGNAPEWMINLISENVIPLSSSVKKQVEKRVQEFLDNPDVIADEMTLYMTSLIKGENLTNDKGMKLLIDSIEKIHVTLNNSSHLIQKLTANPKYRENSIVRSIIALFGTLDEVMLNDKEKYMFHSLKNFVQKPQEMIERTLTNGDYMSAAPLFIMLLLLAGEDENDNKLAYIVLAGILDVMLEYYHHHNLIPPTIKNDTKIVEEFIQIYNQTMVETVMTILLLALFETFDHM